MTMRTFLPEYSQMPVGNRYRPLFKLFADEGWRYVRKDGKPIECDTVGQAIQAAKECVKVILNPPMRSEKMAEREPEMPDFLDADAWRQQKAHEAAEERKALLAEEVLFMKGNRTVKVERIATRRVQS